MPFVKVWSENTPAGSENTNTGDDRIREFKFAMRERLAVDHLAEAVESGVNDYYHTLIHLIQQSTPSLIALIGQLYVKDVSGATELFYLDAAGNEVQLTTSGYIAGPRAALFTAGTVFTVPSGITTLFLTGCAGARVARVAVVAEVAVIISAEAEVARVVVL